MLLALGWFAVAVAGPARVERVQARHAAQEVLLLQRTTTRPGVAEQAVARTLDRFGHLDLRALDRLEAWGATLQPAPALAVPAEPPPAPAPPEDPSLAVPASTTP